MTKEELHRISQYNDRIQTAQGRVTVLTEDERQDLSALLQKWLVENGMTIEETKYGS